MAHGTVMGRASGGCMHEELVMAEGILCTMDGELSMHGRPTPTNTGMTSGPVRVQRMQHRQEDSLRSMTQGTMLCLPISCLLYHLGIMPLLLYHLGLKGRLKNF